MIFVALVRTGSEKREMRLIRAGLLFFIACAVYDNVTMFVGHYDNIEPFSFVVLLICLGIVAARRTPANEQRLTLIQRELEIARRIRLSLLLDSFPVSRRFQAAARYVPMTSVAGDFYEFLGGEGQ
jgi:phosphoserine phosphatase RsbU/P